MRYPLPIVAVLVLGGTCVMAQDDVPSFDVASVKPVTGAPVFGGPSSPDRFVREDSTLLDLVQFAYAVPPFLIEGGPNWVRSSRFTVEARAEAVPSPDEMRLMVRRLLSERFGLRVHREGRDMDRFALVMARTGGRLGERLRPSTLDCAAVVAARGPDYRPPAGLPQPGDPSRCTAMYRVDRGRLTIMLQGAVLSQLTTFLERQVGRTVVDRTGLSGTYDLDLEFTPEVVQVVVNGAVVPAPPAIDTLSLFTALQEQLGLKLEPARGPVELLVIDAAALPTAN